MDFLSFLTNETTVSWILPFIIAGIIIFQLSQWRNKLKRLPWARDAYKAFTQGGEVSTEMNLPGWSSPHIDRACRLQNSQISVVYLVMTGLDGSMQENLNILINTKEKRGGLIVRFLNGEPLDWKRPGAISYHPIHQVESIRYKTLLEEVRNRVFPQ